MNTLTLTAVVQKGHRIELVDPKLPEGQAVRVQVTLEQSPPPRQSLIEFLRSLPRSTRTDAEWAELEKELQRDRDAWDREP